MDGLPSGWGLESGVAPAVKVAKRTKTRAHRKDTKKPSEAKKSQIIIDPEGRKRKEKSDEAMAATDASSKKFKSGSSFSLVSAALSPLAIPYVSDEEIIKWKNRDSLSENEAIIKASSEILVSALNRQTSLQQDRTRLKSLEKERDSFAKQVKDQNAVIEDLQNELNCNKSFYETQLKTQEEVNEGLNTTINALREEKEGWVLEKKKIEKASFRDGFRNYASGFLAQDPDYDFTKFGEETVAWIAKFKVEEAESIKAKRIFLGLEKASPVLDEESEDASSDGIPDHTFEDPPLNESAPAPEVPEDSQVVEKLNDQTQDAS